MILLFFLHLHFVDVTLFIVSGASCVLARKTSIVCLKKCRITNSTKSRRVAMNHLMTTQGSYNLKMLTGTCDSILLTLYTPTSACIFSILFFIHFLRCWQGDFVHQSKASLVGDHFLYSHDLNMWFRADIVGRNQMFVTLRVSRVNDGNEENVSDCK